MEIESWNPFVDILIAMKHIISSYKEIFKSIMQWINEK